MFNLLLLVFTLFSSVSSLSPGNKPIIRKPTAPLENVDLFEQKRVSERFSTCIFT